MLRVCQYLNSRKRRVQCSLLLIVTLRRLQIYHCVYNRRSAGTVFITLGGRRVDSTRRRQILAENRYFCLPHLHSTPLPSRRIIAMTFRMKKK